MSYFAGQYDCKMDAKGRLTLPSKVKSELPVEDGNSLIMSMGFGSDKCLILYTKKEWERFSEEINSRDEYIDENRKLQRKLFLRIAPVELDNAGRILIPKKMTAYAKLEKEIILIGMANRIEIWNPSILESED